jgi:hypothetical protein
VAGRQLAERVGERVSRSCGELADHVLGAAEDERRSYDRGYQEGPYAPARSARPPRLTFVGQAPAVL